MQLRSPFIVAALLAGTALAASRPAGETAPSSTAAHCSADEHWPAWRGPDGTGVAGGAAPTTWSDEQNIKWKVEVPGRGFSTPVIWGDRMFLTTAVALEKIEPPEPPPDTGEGGREGERRGRRGRGRGGSGGSSGPQPKTAFQVLCYDRTTGALLWQRTAKEAKPHEGYHRRYGSHASISPVTDGERLYVSFGSQGIYCYDLDGKLLWEKDLGAKMQIRRAFGEGSAPAVHGDTVVLIFDHEGDSFIAALDTATGETRWRVERDEASCWAMPLILQHGDRWQVVTAGTNRVRSYALEDGALIWECGGLGLNAIPTPVRHEDLVLAMTGFRAPQLLAIELGGEGDLTDGEAVRWRAARGLSYTASPVLADGKLYALMDSGELSCFDAATGEPHYVQTRLERGEHFKASPVAADGKLYCAGESGTVYLIKLGTEFEILATNTLEDEFFVASPVVLGGELFLRGREHLYCISEDGAPEGEDSGGGD